jgi:hypothetical protein
MKTAAFLLTALLAVRASANCTTHTIACAGSATDTIDSSSCGAPVDPYVRYAFQGTAGTKATALVYSQSGAETSVLIKDTAGNNVSSNWSGSDDPSFAEATFTTSGTYFIDVSFANPNVTGKFTISVSCSTAQPPPPADCLYLGTLSCGSHTTGGLESSGCAFTNTSQRYAIYKFNGTGGPIVTFTGTSTAFTPQLALYRSDSTSAVARDTAPSATRSTLRYQLPSDGTYELVISDFARSASSGAFTIDVSCEIPPPRCDAPLITTQPAHVSVPIGGRADLHVAATGAQPLTYQWYLGSYPDTAHPIGGSSPDLTLTNVREPVAVWVHVSNGCSFANSETAMIVIRPPRSRAVRH